MFLNTHQIQERKVWYAWMRAEASSYVLDKDPSTHSNTTMDPEDAAALINAGEGQRTEFKETFAERREAIESLCAFANSEGGTVFVGVRNDGTVCNPNVGSKTLEDFAQMLKQNTSPTLRPSIHKVQLQARRIISMTVPAPRRGELCMAFNVAFLRVGRTNQAMSPDEMRARLLEDSPQAKTSERDEASGTIALLRLRNLIDAFKLEARRLTTWPHVGRGDVSHDEFVTFRLVEAVKKSGGVSYHLSDHGSRVYERLELAERHHRALAALDQQISEGNAILEACGRPREAYVGAPMYFQEICIPRVNAWYAATAGIISELTPEFRGKLDNVGSVTHRTDIKPAMIQQMEKWLVNLGSIEDDLRSRL